MKKSYVTATVRLIVQHDENQDLEEVLENMDYDFTASEGDNADIVDTEIQSWEVTDAK
jgi:hypothetical protein